MQINHFSSKDISQEKLRILKNRIKPQLSPLSPIPTNEKAVLKKISGIKAVLFDIYGTLLVSGTGDISIAKERINIYSVEQIFEDAGLTLLHDDISNLHKEYFSRAIHKSHGMSKNKGIDYPEVDILSIWQDVMNQMLQEELLWGEINLDTLVQISLDYELMVNPVWPMPGALEILKYCSSKELQTGIVSNAQYYTAPSLESLLETSLVDMGFNEKLYSWSFQKGLSKPSREIFKSPLEYLDSIQIKANEVLYLGNDMLNDVWTAHEWGCHTALFAGDSRSLRRRQEDKRCQNLKADIVLTDLSQLKECIG